MDNVRQGCSCKNRVNRLDSGNKEAKKLDTNSDKRLSLNEKIALAKNQLQTIFDVIEDGMMIVDRSLNIIRINRMLAERAGLSPKELIGRKCHRVLWGKEKPCSDCYCNAVFTIGRPIRKKEKKIENGAEPEFFEFSCYPVNQGDHPVMVIEHIKDITEEKKVFEHQMRTETLASIGIMVAGIAHEINNPLSGISGISGNMIKMPQRYGLNNKGISRIEAVYESANRAESIMKDLLNLSRKKEYAVRSVNLRELVDQALSSVHFEGYRTVNKTITGEEMVLAYCDPEKIRQVLINLINNAAYAVLSRREEFPDETYEPSIKINIGKKSKAAVISIIDNGSGIETDYLKKIFDPFFTTKEPGQGTGLGLSICNKIITEHKGSLNVDSTPGRTEFIIELPLRKGRNYSEKNTDS